MTKVTNMGKISKNIQQRGKPKDVFYTPEILVKKHIDMIDTKETDIWYDDSAGDLVYYDNFPTKKKYWSEISRGKDLFKFNQNVDIICGNPPYSQLTSVMEKSISLKPRIISYLIGQHNFIPNRLKMMNDNGYGLTKLHIFKVRGWFGFSYICVWEKDKKDIISFDTKNYFGKFPLIPDIDKWGNKKKR